MNDDEWIELMAEFIFTAFSYPAGKKTASRRWRRAWNTIPEDVRRRIADRQKEKFDEVIATLPKGGTLKDLSER